MAYLESRLFTLKFQLKITLQSENTAKSLTRASGKPNLVNVSCSLVLFVTWPPVYIDICVR